MWLRRFIALWTWKSHRMCIGGNKPYVCPGGSKTQDVLLFASEETSISVFCFLCLNTHNSVSWKNRFFFFFFKIWLLVLATILQKTWCYSPWYRRGHSNIYILYFFFTINRTPFFPHNSDFNLEFQLFSIFNSESEFKLKHFFIQWPLSSSVPCAVGLLWLF